ncbi:ATP-binding protein [Fusobacterium sp. MFO224]|uniref:ATP-binding protein n=1 Tax=Fusobacterium sp. MFO224 TaxID=3378070 RepID=UPI0038529A2C
MNINEIVVISGKGGTGKTTLTSCLVPYIENIVIADCDVDAPDLDILFNSKIEKTENFSGLDRAHLNEDKCIKCGKCYEVCKFGAITKDIQFKEIKCEGCSVCKVVCPVGAIEMVENKTGEVYLGDSKYGRMIHAKLIPGEEASGKLVAQVRQQAKKFAKENNVRNILVDGSPGIGCNVISSIMGAKKVIMVCEPTYSGLHDLERVYELVSNYPIQVFIVINKFDISLEMTEKIEEFAKNKGLKVNLKVPFDRRIVNSIVEKKIPSLKEKELFEKIGFFEFIKEIIN